MCKCISGIRALFHDLSEHISISAPCSKMPLLVICTCCDLNGEPYFNAVCAGRCGRAVSACTVDVLCGCALSLIMHAHTVFMRHTGCLAAASPPSVS